MTKSTTDSVTAAMVQRALREIATDERAAVQARFFKTGRGEYGEGDVFIGVKVPEQRVIAKRFDALSVEECARLLASETHEDRLTALLIWVRQFQRARGPDAQSARDRVYRGYLDNIDRVNNWDLVDSSAEHIVGVTAITDKRALAMIHKLSRSKSLWHRRIAVLSSFAWIKRGDASLTIELAERLIEDPHDLMHKAIGWMLREVAKHVAVDALRAFLEAHAADMPRTMLRYAIEKLPERERKQWLSRK